MLRLVILAVAALVTSAATTAATPARGNNALALAQSARETLAPTGTLRVAFLGTNPVQGRVDPATGAVTGPAADLVKELAMRISVAYRLLPAADPRAVIELLRGGAADFGFLAFDATRATEVDFAGPYARMLSSFVVAQTSSLRTSADVDREGITVGVVKGVSQQFFLSGHLTKARIQLFAVLPSPEEIEKLFASGAVTAFGMNRQRALDLQSEARSLRALPDSFFDIDQEFVVPKGAAARRDLLAMFAQDVRDSGFVQSSLNQAHLEDSTSVVR